MDHVQNPYRPGAGRRPPVLAGRAAILDAFDVVRRRAEQNGEGDRGWILNGLRGVGKTVLLTDLEKVSEDGWITVKIEAGGPTSLAVSLAGEMVKALRTATGRHPESNLRRLLGVFKAFTVKIDPSSGVSLGIDITPIAGVADSGRFADDLYGLFEVLGETARDLGVGALILIDELQDGDAADLKALTSALHRLGQAPVPLPVVFVGAGLPSLPAVLAEANSYAERLYDYWVIGKLDDQGSRDALVIPTERLGVSWSAAGLDEALATATGYPYFLQAIGKHVWDISVKSPIGLQDVELGLAAARKEVDAGLYRSRWDRATPAQRDLMRTLATIAIGDMASIADLAKAMGKNRVTDLSVSRSELIKKGLLYSPERGLLAFTVPGMDDFIQRLTDS
jgi:AAA ATPase domain